MNKPLRPRRVGRNIDRGSLDRPPQIARRDGPGRIIGRCGHDTHAVATGGQPLGKLSVVPRDADQVGPRFPS